MKGTLAKSVLQKTYGFARLGGRKGPIHAGFRHDGRNMAIRPKGREFAWIAAHPLVRGRAAMFLFLIEVLAKHAFKGRFEDAHALINLLVTDDEGDENAQHIALQSGSREDGSVIQGSRGDLAR